MAERTYNGFTNRETWLVNVFYRDEILDYSTSIESSLEFVKEEIQDRIDRFMDVPNNARSIVQELICSKEIVEKINWVELEDQKLRDSLTKSGIKFAENTLTMTMTIINVKYSDFDNASKVITDAGFEILN